MQIQSESAKIFYTQKRVGLHGKEIKIYKFRSMVPNLSSFLSSRILFEILAYKSGNISKVEPELEEVNNLLVFCRIPRTRKEICEYLGLSSVTYTIQTHVMPLVESGKIKMTNPEKPKSPKQLYYSE